MKVVLFLGLFDIIYGILGLFGIQNISQRYRGTSFEREYKSYCGKSNILTGIPWVIVYFIAKSLQPEFAQFCILIIAGSLPSIIYCLVVEKKFKKMLEAEKNNTAAE